MATAKIPKGKKRYYLTLTEKRAEKFKKRAVKLGLGRNFISAFVDEQLEHGLVMLDGIEKALKQGDKIDPMKIVDGIVKESKQMKLFED